MSETKTYVFGNDGQCGGGMMSLLAPLLQRNGLDPNLLLAMNKNGNGWVTVVASCGLSSCSSSWDGAATVGVDSAATDVVP